jgi:putative ABC transport system permease protein
MTAASRKAFGDAWRERTRSVFVIVTITTGVAAFLALLGTFAVLTRELNRGYLDTNPASAILHTKFVDQKVLNSVESDPELSAAEARRVIFARTKTGPAQWRNLALFVIANFRDVRLNKFVPEQGAWPPGRGEVLIERDALSVARTKIGDDIVFRTENGPVQTLRVTGQVHDVGQPQARMETAVYGYVTEETAELVGSPAGFDRLLIQVAHDKYNTAHIHEVAGRLKERLQAEGYRVDQIEFPAPGKHPHADLMGALLLAVSSFGLFLVLLSGILTLNFIAALMAAQIRQIGIMKTLGGTRLQIARIYLFQAVLLGGIATTLALPLGIWGCHVLAKVLAALLNFDIADFSIPAWVFTVAAGAGIGVPVIACAVPLWRSVAMPVRRALASTGASAEAFGAGWIDRAVAGLGGAARPVLLAVRNSFRRRMRLLLTCATLTCAAMFFMAALNLRVSMIDTFDRLFGGQRYDLTLNLEQMDPIEKLDRALHGAAGVRASENWLSLDGWVARPGDDAEGGPGNSSGEERGNHFTAIGMPPDSRLFVPVMTQGQSLQTGDPRSVVLNQTMAAQNPQLRVGDQVRLQIGSEAGLWRVAGICREPMQPPPTVFVSYYALPGAVAGKANIIQIALKDADRTSLERARQEIDPRLEGEGVRASGGRSKAEFRAAVDQHVLMIYVFLVLASCIIGGVGGLGLLTTMSINILERRREIGILRAIGASPTMISAIVIGEAITIACLAWGAAVLMAYPLGKLLAGMVGGMMNSPFYPSMSPIGIALALVASVFVASIASLTSAVSAVRITAREALAYE